MPWIGFTKNLASFKLADSTGNRHQAMTSTFLPVSPTVRQLEHMREHFDAMAPRHDYWRQRRHHYYSEQTIALKRLIEPGLSVLEVGCATGETLAALEPKRGVGVDLSPEMVSRATERYSHLRFQVGAAENLDLDGETFDVVLLADLVGEIQDLWSAFRAMRNVVHERSRVVIACNNFLWQPLVELAQALKWKRPQVLQNWFTISDIENLLSINGFERVRKDDCLLTPVIVPKVSTLLNRHVASLPLVHHLNLVQFVIARPSPSFAQPPAQLSTTVVIPAKNERGNIRNAIRRTPKMGTRTEIIFVEGGSSDGTADEIRKAIKEEPTECDLRFLAQTGKGKGDAVRTAFAEASGDVLMILDADLTVMPEDLPRFYLAIAEGRGQFINGSRLVYTMEDQAMRHLNRIANAFFGRAFSWILGQPLKDTLCGTKVIRRIDYERIAADRAVFGELDPFGDFDLLFGAARLGLRIAEIPVRYQAREYGETQIDRFRHGLKLFRMLGVGHSYFKTLR